MPASSDAGFGASSRGSRVERESKFFGASVLHDVVFLEFRWHGLYVRKASVKLNGKCWREASVTESQEASEKSVCLQYNPRCSPMFNTKHVRFGRDTL